MPQIERYSNPLSFTAEAAITGKRVVVHGTTDGQCNMPGGADVAGMIGVARASQATVGGAVVVDGPGSYVQVQASGAVTRGASLAIDGTSGKVKAVTTADTHIVGYSVSDCTTDGDVIWMLVWPTNNS